MAITTVDGAIAGAQPPYEYFKVATTQEAVGQWFSFAYVAGNPGAMTAPSSGIGGAAITSRTGSLPFTNPVSGETRLMRLSCSTPVVGTLLLVDRLWDNSGISSTTTTGQTINSATWPARDANGSTDGVGVMVGLEVSSATTSANTAATITYTNSGNTGSRTGSFGANMPNTLNASAVAGVFVPFALAAGDVGVRSIQTLTLSTTLTAGTVHLVAYRVLASIGCSLPYVDYSLDLVTGGNVRMYDNTVPMLLWIPSATTATGPRGSFIYTQG